MRSPPAPPTCSQFRESGQCVNMSSVSSASVPTTTTMDIDQIIQDFTADDDNAIFNITLQDPELQQLQQQHQQLQQETQALQARLDQRKKNRKRSASSTKQQRSKKQSTTEPAAADTQPPPAKKMKKCKLCKKLKANPGVKCSVATQTETVSTDGWLVKPANDAPAISWTDSKFQYTVQNPTNNGRYLMKLQVYDEGRLRHISGVYTDPKTEVCATMMRLITQLETLWVDRKTGEAKQDGVTRSKMELAAWRSLPDLTKTPRKKQEQGQQWHTLC